MATVYVPSANSEVSRSEWSYHNKYLTWKGFYDKVPLLRGIIDTTADAVTASWRTYGSNDKSAADKLDAFEGNGKESFKLMMNAAAKACIVNGDYFAEIVGEDVEDIHPLQPENIAIVVNKNGTLKRYEEITGNSQWRPEEIFHLAWNRMPGQVHGNSSVAPLNDTLIDLQQMMDTGSKIFRLYSNPYKIVYVSTDLQSTVDSVRDDIRKAQRTPGDALVVDEDTIKKIESQGVPQFSTLNPGDWQKKLVDMIIMSTRVPELALGTGSVNSEESAKMQIDGFRAYVRWFQKFLEENVRRQLFTQMFGDKVPHIRFSFAAEPQEERFNRLMQSYQIVAQTPAVNPEHQTALIRLQAKLLEEAGLFE